MPKEGTSDSVYSSLADRMNYKEYVFVLPDSVMVGPDGQAQYTTNGVQFNGFKYFAVKILLLGDNPAIVPRVADLRCIALQL